MITRCCGRVYPWLQNRENDLVSRGHAGSGEVLHQVIITKPDLITIDLRLKNDGGLELISTLKSQRPLLPTLLSSEHDEMIYAERALKVGALGYGMKQDAADKILTAIAVISSGVGNNKRF
jgi:DNA-binding NarL/FixJ family response regulator